MSKQVVNGACRKGSVGPTGRGQNGARTSPSLPVRSHDQPRAPFFSFLFLFSLPPLGIPHQLQSKDISSHTDERTCTFALGCGRIGVAMSLPVEPTSAGRACSSCWQCSTNAPHCCPVPLFSSPLSSLISDHKFLKENLLLFLGFRAQLSG